nr:hypothetical protein [Tanacetum cinerariifolium]
MTKLLVLVIAILAISCATRNTSAHAVPSLPLPKTVPSPAPSSHVSPTPAAPSTSPSPVPSPQPTHVPTSGTFANRGVTVRTTLVVAAFVLVALI